MNFISRSRRSRRPTSNFCISAATSWPPKSAAPSLFDGLDDFVAEHTALNADVANADASPLHAASTAAVGTPERARLLLQIHDELLFETRRADADALAKIVVEEMRLGDPLTVPLQIDAEIGANWGEL